MQYAVVWEYWYSLRFFIPENTSHTGGYWSDWYGFQMKPPNWVKHSQRWSGRRDRPSWRARAGARIKNVVNHTLERANVALPPEWHTWTEEQQLVWARQVLAELAIGSEQDKVRSMAASALARSLEPKGRPPPTQPSQDGSTGQPKSKEYLLAVKAELDAELEKLDGKEH